MFASVMTVFNTTNVVKISVSQSNSFLQFRNGTEWNLYSHGTLYCKCPRGSSLPSFVILLVFNHFILYYYIIFNEIENIFVLLKENTSILSVNIYIFQILNLRVNFENVIYKTQREITKLFISKKYIFSP